MNTAFFRKPVVGFSIFLFLSISAIQQSTHAEEAAKPHAKAHAHWAYEGESGPEHWGDLQEDFAACKTGANQSPVDLAGPGKPFDGQLKFSYSESPLKIINNGHTIQVNYAPGSLLMIGDKRYNLAQFHFHTPSEHKASGNPYDMEVHLVHRSDAGELAVVGVFMKKGQNNEKLGSFWGFLPMTIGKEMELKSLKVNAADLLPKQQAFFHYPGSLTTPPCSEGVQWFVMKTPIEVSAEQVEKFRKIVHNNARPVQPRGERVLMDKSGS